MYESTVTTGIHIDGVGREASSGRTYPIYNPARPDELVGRAACANIDDVGNAVEAAHRAFPGWAAPSYQERAAMLMTIADQLGADA